MSPVKGKITKRWDICPNYGGKRMENNIKNLRPNKSLLTDIEQVNDDNAVIGYYKDKLIIYNFITNELCYQEGADEYNRSLFPVGSCMLDELTPVTKLSNNEQADIYNMFPQNVIEEAIEMFG